MELVRTLLVADTTFLAMKFDAVDSTDSDDNDDVDESY